MQENPDEIPSGALPRSIDIILRHEQVTTISADVERVDFEFQTFVCLLACVG